MRIQKEFEKLQNTIDRLSNTKEKAIVKNYATILRDIRTILSEIYAKYADKNSILTYSELLKYNRMKKFEEELINVLNGLAKENSKLIRAGLRMIYKTSFDDTKAIIEERTGKTIRGVIRDDIIQNSLMNPISGLTLNERLQKNRNTVVYDIRQRITQGLVKGESYKQMADRVKEGLENDTSKALRVVRTEAHRVMEDSKYQSLTNANNQGVKMTKTWLSSQDEKVRSSHKKLNNKTIPFEEEFKSPNGGKGKAPGQMGNAADDINCRCIFVVNVE